MIAFTLPLRMPLLNTILRTNHWKRSRLRQALAWQVAAALSKAKIARPATPFLRAFVTVTRHSPKTADTDGIYGSAKALLDVLQPVSKACPSGLGIIANDSPDCLVLVVRQVKSKLVQTDVTIELL